MKRFARIFCLLAGLSFLGCTNNPPRIQDYWWLPVTVNDGGTLHRELMLYLQVDDEEGADDLAEIRLRNLENDLVWKVDKSTWSKKKNSGVLWLGSSRFASYGTALEEGPYRLILEDKGGREHEIPLELEGWLSEQDLEDHLVRFDGEGGTIIVESPSDSWYLIAADEDENFSPRSLPVGEEISLGEYFTFDEGDFYLILYERNRMAASKWGPYFFSSPE
ncbi:MAG: hypothetical protein PQJ60_07715 [Spirochaetales bacterium]|nr:hypothetical protein [Spirochaetales bacterium]